MPSGDTPCVTDTKRVIFIDVFALKCFSIISVHSLIIKGMDNYLLTYGLEIYVTKWEINPNNHSIHTL